MPVTEISLSYIRVSTRKMLRFLTKCSISWERTGIPASCSVIPLIIGLCHCRLPPEGCQISLSQVLIPEPYSPHLLMEFLLLTIPVWIKHWTVTADIPSISNRTFFFKKVSAFLTVGSYHGIIFVSVWEAGETAQSFLRTVNWLPMGMGAASFFMTLFLMNSAGIQALSSATAG